jgi:hypothetical protein
MYIIYKRFVSYALMSTDRGPIITGHSQHFMILRPDAYASIQTGPPLSFE